MKLICHIYDESRTKTRAIVRVVYGDKERKRLRLNRNAGTYEIDLDVKPGEKLRFLITKKECEPIEQIEFARQGEYRFVLGKKGTNYQRFGNIKEPLKKYDNYYIIEGSGKEFQQILEQLNLEPVTEIDGEKLKVKNVFVKKRDKKKKGKKGQLRQFQADLETLRNHASVDAAGPVSKIQNRHSEILSNEFLVKFKANTSISKIKQAVQNCGLTISHKNSFGEYIIKSGPNCGYDLYDHMEELYSSGLVDLMFPRTLTTTPEDADPTNFLWEGQYSHDIIETKEAWDALETANGTPLKFGTGDILVGVADNGLTPKDEGGGTYTQNASFLGDVISADGTTPITKIKLHDFRDDPKFGPTNNHSVDGSTHGSNVGGIISAKANLTIGTAGVAGNTRLFSIIVQTIAFDQKIEAFYWAAGLKKYADGDSAHDLTQLGKGFDVLASSLAFDVTSSLATVSGEEVLTDKFKDLVEQVLLRGRSGRGALMVFSAGNESTSHTYIPPALGSSETNRFSVYDGVLSIGATGLYTDHNGERKSSYSNTGKIDFCAPASSGGVGYGTFSHDPTRNYRTWSTTTPGKGELPGTINASLTKQIQHDLVASFPFIDDGNTISVVFPLRLERPETDVDESVNVSESVIDVDDTTDFIAGITAVISDEGSGKSEEFRISAVGADNITVDADTPIGQTFPSTSKINGGTTVPETKLSANANSGDPTFTVSSSDGFTANMRVLIWKTSMPSSNEFVTISAATGGVLTIAGGGVLSNTFLSADDVDVIGLTTINVANVALYSINQRIVIEYVSHAITYFDQVIIYDIDAGANEIYVRGMEYNHRIENGMSVVIRDPYYYKKLSSSATLSSPLASGYNPSDGLQNMVTSGQHQMDVNTPGSFKPNTIVKVSSVSGTDWKKILTITGNTLNFDPTDTFGNSHAVVGTTVTGYPGLTLSGSDLEINEHDHLEVKHASDPTMYVEVVHFHSSSHTCALRPLSSAISSGTWEDVTRVKAVRLNNTTGLSDDDVLLIGDPNYNETTRVEASESIKIKKVLASSNTILLDDLRKAHNSAGGTLNVYKGDLDYTEKFGGTSSASPTVGGGNCINVISQSGFNMERNS